MNVPAIDKITTLINPATGRAIVKVERTPEGWVIQPAPHATLKLEDGIMIEPHRKNDTDAPYATDIPGFPE